MYAIRDKLNSLKETLKRKPELAEGALSGVGATPRASTRRVHIPVEMIHTNLEGVGVVVMKGTGPNFDESVQDMHNVHKLAPEVTPEVLLDTRTSDGARLVVVSASSDVENGNVATLAKVDPSIVEECAAALLAAAASGVGADRIDLNYCHVIGSDLYDYDEAREVREVREVHRNVQINGMRVGGGIPTSFEGASSEVRDSVASALKGLKDKTVEFIGLL